MAICTLDPDSKDSNIQLLGNNLIAKNVDVGNGWEKYFGNVGISGGSYIYAVHLTGFTADTCIGISGKAATVKDDDNYVGLRNDEWILYNNGQVYAGGGNFAYGSALALDDVVMVGLTHDATGKLFLGKNDTWFNSADPAAGTGYFNPGGVDLPSLTNIPTVYPGFSLYTINNWFTHAFTREAIELLGITIPDGFSPWSDSFPENVGWNPSDKHADVTLTNPQTMRNDSGGANVRGARGIFPNSLGLIYMEFQVINATDFEEIYLGIDTGSASLTAYTGSDANSWGYRMGTGYLFNGGSSTEEGDEFSDIGDRLNIAINRNTGSLWVGRNGSFQGNPVTGASPAATGLPAAGTQIFVMGTTGNDGDVVTIALAEDEFIDDIPTGYSAWLSEASSGTGAGSMYNLGLSLGL